MVRLAKRQPHRIPGLRMLRPLLGAHMSVAGGLEHALAAGTAAGCDCIQIFVKNSTNGVLPPSATIRSLRYLRNAVLAAYDNPVGAGGKRRAATTTRVSRGNRCARLPHPVRVRYAVSGCGREMPVRVRKVTGNGRGGCVA